MFTIPSILVLAQVLNDTAGDRVAAENAAFVFSGPQFFTALVAGVILSFAFQLLMTNLGLAALMSMMTKDSGPKRRVESHRERDDSSVKIGPAVGLATMISLAVALFLASLFATKLSLLASPTMGAIVGLVIWATYFVVMIWFSSTTVGSLLGSIVNTATAGLQTLLTSVGAVFGAKAMNRQVVATAEAAAAAVRRELGNAIDPVSLRESVQDYIDAIKPPSLDWNRVKTDFEAMLSEPGVKEIIANGELSHIDRQTFVDLVGSRSDLSKQEIDRLADQLEAVWKKTVKQTDKAEKPDNFLDYIKSATKEQLLGKEFSSKLDEFLARNRGDEKNPNGMGAGSMLTMGLNGLIGLIMGRTDLSDLDMEKIIGQLNRAKEKVGEKTENLVDRMGPEPSYSPIKADIEHFLANAYSWQMKPGILRLEFRNLLYDREADPETVLNELERITRKDFITILEHKGLMTRSEIRSTADLLNDVRLEVLGVARTAREQELSMEMLAGAEDYLINSPKEELLDPELLELNFSSFIEDADATYPVFEERLQVLNRPLLEKLLEQRGDFNEMEISPLLVRLENVRNTALAKSRQAQVEREDKVKEIWLKLANYLRETSKERLTPALIGQELGAILKETRGAEDFDRPRLTLLLSQRSDLTDTEAEAIIDEIEKNWLRARVTGRQLTGKVQEQYDSIAGAIGDYLRSTGKAELNPEGIKRDLNLLLQDPKAGTSAIRRRLGRMDRDTLVKLLSRREDLSEEQVERVISEVQENLRTFAKTPRRLARRTREEMRNFKDSLAEYLRSTDKEELNPEGIQRDLNLLLNDPRAGVESLKERLSHFDRETLVALLSQREDIDPKDVDRIIDRMMVVRERFLEQLHGLQLSVQKRIDTIFARIRDYLDGLERPELNYDGIRRDFKQLFDDPEAGFMALRERFSQVDRDTLIAILSSRDDISPAQAERIISGIEGTRDRILQKAERFQEQAQLRLEQVKIEAEKQRKEAIKAAAKAAWWLFFIALVSALAAAFGGAIGVIKPI